MLLTSAGPGSFPGEDSFHCDLKQVFNRKLTCCWPVSRKDRYPKIPAREREGYLAVCIGTAGVKLIAASIDYGGHGKACLRCECRLQVSADHVGQFAERIPYIVVDCAGRIHRQELAGESACLLSIAFECYNSAPVPFETY